MSKFVRDMCDKYHRDKSEATILGTDSKINEHCALKIRLSSCIRGKYL